MTQTPGNNQPDPHGPGEPGPPEDSYPEDARRLLQVLRDAEAEIIAFRTQLEDDLATDRELIIEAQHEEINQLEDHLKSATVRWRDVYDFIREAFAPIRERRSDSD